MLKQLRGESYRELAFALRDSATAQRFARLDGHRAPGKSALQAAVGSVSAATWERINGALLEAARSDGVEDGSQVRVDSTVTETDILSPTDSGLLGDAVPVLPGEGRGSGRGGEGEPAKTREAKVVMSTPPGARQEDRAAAAGRRLGARVGGDRERGVAGPGAVAVRPAGPARREAVRLREGEAAGGRRRRLLAAAR